MTDEPDFIDVSETEEVREMELPRWVHVPVGIVLSLFTLLCGFASTYLLFVPNKRAPHSGVCCRIHLAARLCLGTRKVHSFDN